MADENAHTDGPTAGPKRRKTRKGTQSCWECKRRKVRCIFTASSTTICNNCQYHGTNCIGQDLPDVPARSTPGSRRDWRVMERLSRMETTVEKLAQSVDTNNAYLSKQLQELLPQRSQANSNSTTATLLETTSSLPSTLLCPDTATTLEQEPRTEPKHNAVSAALLAAWPCQRDLDLIRSLPFGILALFHGTACISHSAICHQDEPLPRDNLRLPSPGSHPVLVARKLLFLAISLQMVPPSSEKKLAGLSVDHTHIMSRAVETAVSLVVSNDELVNSIEGIECIFSESMYQNNAGNLPRAYLGIRRAMSMAQIMGLHRGADSAPFTLFGSDNQSGIDPGHMWFRIVQSDRYLSMTMGLPQGSLENSFASPNALGVCTPWERMKRLECAASGRIMARIDSDITNLDQLQEIDEMLHKASAVMPPQWWLAPDVSSCSGNGIEAVRETIRLMDQLTHFHLLAQLHLPYLLCFSSDRKYDYSKITTVNASREVLTRFVAFRNLPSAGTYCRGVDYLAFAASTVICLAHIGALHQHKSDGCSIFDLFAHQRFSDRGLLERALGMFENIAAQTRGDAIAQKVAGMLGHLLAVEADAFQGATYETTSSAGRGSGKLECQSTMSDNGRVLSIYIPHSGTIRLERSNVFSQRTAALPGHSTESAPDNLNWQAVPQKSGSATDDSCITSCESNQTQDPQIFMSWSGASMAGWTLQDVEAPLFDNPGQSLSDADGTQDELLKW